MNEEKDLLETEETAAEEVVEEVVETADEVIEEAEEVVEEATAEIEEILEDVIEEAEEDEEKKVYTRVSLIKAVIITLVVCGILMVAEYYFMDSRLNHYNLNEDGYATTLDDAAEQTGVTLEEFIKENGLPEDMPGDTITAVAGNYITLGKTLELQGMGEDMIPMFAQMYGIDESRISKDMYMGEFYKLVEEAQKAAAEETAEDEEAPAEGEETPVEGEEAPTEGEEASAEVEETPAAE